MNATVGGSRPPEWWREIRRHPLATYVGLACLFSWSYWMPLAIWAPHVTHVPGLLGPMLAAVVVTVLVDGMDGLRDLAARSIRWRVAPTWYVTALAPAVVAIVVLAVEGVVRAVQGHGGHSGFVPGGLGTMAGVPDIGLVGLVAVLVVVNGFGEEAGWRGFAWPELRRDHGLARAALLVAIPWAIWHVPTFWLDTGLADMDAATTVGWLIALPFGALVLGWLYERSGSSIWIVALFHAAVNWGSATPATTGIPAMVVSMAVIVGAVVILVHEAARTRRGWGR